MGAVKSTTIDVVQREYKQRGGRYWFDAGTMRFFSSRLMGTALRDDDGCLWFVSSERFDENHARRYTVRVLDTFGSISTVGAFQRFASRNGALKAMYRWATSGVPESVAAED